MDKEKQKKPNKTAKSKQAPLKVVYITNPIKIKTSASEFRSLVQELTGKDSDVSASSKYFAAADGGGGSDLGGGGQNKVAGKDQANIYDNHVPRNIIGQSSINIDGHDNLPPGSESDPSSLIDEMYTIEDFQGIMGFKF